MAAAKNLRAAEKQAICRKLITALRKRYKDPVPKNSLPVLETMIFAACLENSSYDHATSAYARLNDDFFDLNEIRVSSIAELEAALPRQPERFAAVQQLRPASPAYDFETARQDGADEWRVPAPAHRRPAASRLVLG